MLLEGGRNCDVVELSSLLNDQINSLVDILPSVNAIANAELAEGEAKRHGWDLKALAEDTLGIMYDTKGIANFRPIVKEEMDDLT